MEALFIGAVNLLLGAWVVDVMVRSLAQSWRGYYASLDEEEE